MESVGTRSGIVRFFEVPPEMKSASGSHSRPSIVDFVVAPQSIKIPVIDC